MYFPSFTGNTVQLGQVFNDNPSSVILGTPEATGTSPFWPVLTPDFRFLYVANQGSRDISQYAVGASGALVPLTPAKVPSQTPTSPFSSIAVEPDGNHLYALESGANAIDIFPIAADGTLSPANQPVSTGLSPAQLVFFPASRPKRLTMISPTSPTPPATPSGPIGVTETWACSLP